MSKIPIFSTGYEWNWLHTLNQFIDGAAWGAGLVLVFVLFVRFVNGADKKTKKSEAIDKERK